MREKELGVHADLRVLLVEDLDDDAAMIGEALRFGHQVTRVDDLPPAVEALTNPKVFDVVLLDLGLPSSNGLPTLQRIREVAPGLPVVICTRASAEDSGPAAVRVGAAEFVEKGDFDPELLRRTLRHSVERHLAGQRVRELSDFTVSAAHELRGPVRAVQQFSSFMLEDYGAEFPAEARHGLQQIGRAAMAMSALLDGLEALAGLSDVACRRASCDIGQIAAALVESLRAQDPERQVEVLLPETWITDADPSLLTLLLRNLLSNAWKYTRENAVAHISLSARREDGRDVFAVEDDGVGFDNAHAEALFEAFRRFQPRSSYGGSGLGLAMVARIVERHGGEITAEGSLGGGARFTFTLN